MSYVLPRAPFEVLLRRALTLPSRPAVVVLHGFRWSGVKEEDKGEGRTRVGQASMRRIRVRGIV